jgi:photosystem II stability/assembly factor-like uncharacterized protein
MYLTAPRRGLKILLTVAAIGLCIIQAFAQVSWVSVPGCGDPGILALAVNAANNDLWVSMASPFDHGGYSASTLLRSTDRGQTWSSVPTGTLPGQATLAVGFTPSGAILAGLQFQRVYRLSNSNATTWQAAGTGIPTNTNVQCFAMTHAGHMLCGGGSSIYISTDDGFTWTAASGSPGSTVNAIIRGAASGEMWAAAGNGVFRSTNGGSQWSAVTTGLSSTAVRSLALAADGSLFAATAGGLFRLPSGGNSWALFSAALSPTDLSGVCFLGSTLWVSTRSAGAWCTDDNGATWSAATGLRSLSCNHLQASADGSIYCSSAGLFTTTSQSWDEVTPPGEWGMIKSLWSVTGRTIVAGTINNGVYRTSNRGVSWSFTGLQAANIWNFAQHPGGDLFACINGTPPGFTMKIHRSTDNGSSWLPVNNSAFVAGSTVSVKGMVFAPDGTGYAATFASPSNVLRSTNGGLDWGSPENSGNPAISLARSASGDLYLGCEVNGLWKKPAGGSWFEITGFRNRNVYEVKFAPDGSVIIPSSGSGGRGIACLPPGSTVAYDIYTGGPVFACIVMPDGAIYGGTRTGVIYFPNNSANQSPLSASTGLPSCGVLEFCLARDGYLYAGTGGRGLYCSNTIVQTPVSAYHAWLRQSFGQAGYADPAIAADTADPDADGLANLLEYAVSTDALISQAQPHISVVPGSPSQVTYKRRAGLTEMRVEIETSYDLATWFSGPSAVQEVSAVPAADGAETITATVLFPTGPRTFVRLRATGL